MPVSSLSRFLRVLTPTVICLFWTFHTDAITQHVLFCVWLLSLSVMFSRFTLLSHISLFHLFSIAEQYPVVWMYHILCIHSSADGHLGCFHFFCCYEYGYYGSIYFFRSHLPLCPSLLPTLVTSAFFTLTAPNHLP